MLLGPSDGLAPGALLGEVTDWSLTKGQEEGGNTSGAFFLEVFPCKASPGVTVALQGPWVGAHPLARSCPYSSQGSPVMGPVDTYWWLHVPVPSWEEKQNAGQEGLAMGPGSWGKWGAGAASVDLTSCSFCIHSLVHSAVVPEPRPCRTWDTGPGWGSVLTSFTNMLGT